MRPVNLIPADEGRAGVGKQGVVAYAVVGALFVLLGGVTLLVITNNQISERKTEVAHLQRQNATAEARAARLAAYTTFDEVRNQRVAAVSSLADSRFDWERVMRELSLILPKSVWLTSLTGTASPEAQVEGSGGISLRSSVQGPALELIGCGTGQNAVAGFVSALKDVDGVTRVGVQSSELSETAGEAESVETDSAGSAECKHRTAKFEIVVAFDAAPVPALETAGVVTEATAPTEAAGSTEAPPAPESTSTSAGE
jgi:Tfp pilus assembly protein PilN